MAPRQPEQLDTEHEWWATCHPQPDRYIGFQTPALELVDCFGGRTDPSGDVASQVESIENFFEGATTYWSAGAEGEYGDEAATTVLLGL